MLVVGDRAEADEAAAYLRRSGVKDATIVITGVRRPSPLPSDGTYVPQVIRYWPR